MSLLEKTMALRKDWAVWASVPDWAFLVRHDLLAEKKPATVFAQIWRWGRRVMASIGVLPPLITRYDWRVTLKHSSSGADGKILVIWAVGGGQDDLRRLCQGFAERFQITPGWAPVLVTDVADFAFYSRLGWLVEYLPALSGVGDDYAIRKRCYLAWRYRGACVVPVEAGLANAEEWQTLLKVNKK